MAAKGDCGLTLRVVLLGKTGAGKSSLGNALTGKKPPKAPAKGRDDRPPDEKDPATGFKVGRGLKSETVYCDWDIALRCNTVIEVTDTPGLCDTHLPEAQIYREVAKSVAVAEPGPNVIIFTLRCDRRFTEEEYKAYQKIQALFSPEMNKYLILVFNGLDCYDHVTTLEEQQAVLQEEISSFEEPLSKMVAEANHRFFGINNKASEQDRDRQVEQLVAIMKDLVLTNGKHSCYSTEMTEEIMRRVEEMVQEEAEASGTALTTATADVKRKIIREDVKPGLFDSLVGAVSKGAAKVKDGVSSMCSVM